MQKLFDKILRTRKRLIENMKRRFNTKSNVIFPNYLFCWRELIWYCIPEVLHAYTIYWKVIKQSLQSILLRYWKYSPKLSVSCQRKYWQDHEWIFSFLSNILGCHIPTILYICVFEFESCSFFGKKDIFVAYG